MVANASLFSLAAIGLGARQADLFFVFVVCSGFCHTLK